MRLLAATAGLILWLAYFIAVYLVADLGCAAGAAAASLRTAMLAATVLALVAMLALGGYGWLLGRTAADAQDESCGQRARFHGSLAIGVTVIAVTATAWVALPLLLVAPCR